MKTSETETHRIYCICGIKFKFRKEKNNRIIVVNPDGTRETVKKFKGLKVLFTGCNSEIVIHTPCKLNECRFKLFTNTRIEIFSTVNRIWGVDILTKQPGGEVIIGSNFHCTDRCRIINSCEPNNRIVIGDDCMFATDIYIRNNDGHTIIDRSTGKVINQPRDVVIGNHVWLGYHTTLLKGATIADGCVVGAESIVSKPLTEPNSIYAGQPAKLIKSNIQWFRERICDYLEQHPEAQ